VEWRAYSKGARFTFDFCLALAAPSPASSPPWAGGDNLDLPGEKDPWI